MAVVMVWRWLLLAGCLLRRCLGGTCLSDVINASDWINLTSSFGSYPVGIYVNNWDASFVTNGVARILIEEKLGYNVVENGPGGNTLTGYYALLGCERPENRTDRGCGPQVTYSHINMEAWSEGYAAEWKEIQRDYVSMAPVEAGSMGYEGVSAHFVSRETWKSAYYGDGAALDFYRSWNASWTESWKYFDSLASVDRTSLLPCGQTRFANTPVMQNYVRVTGDAAGIETGPDGTLVAICPDGYFWPGPSCRADPSKCVPYFTQQPGWGVEDAMQKVTSFDMPIAVGVATNWAQTSRQVNSVFYWWMPDTTFLDLDPLAINYPAYDFNAYASGDKRTATAGSAIVKIVSQDLRSLAPRVEDLIRNMRFNLNDVMNMMKDKLTSGDSHLDAACRWLRANSNTWQPWLPDRTKCFPGFGLYDTSLEEFTSSRDTPTFVECRACASGRYSARLDDEAGITYECKLCEPGTSQGLGGALQCEPCQPGTYQHNSGSQDCDRCSIGEYQDQMRSVSCTPCPNGGITLGFGSVTLGDCGCAPGSLNVGQSDENLTCVECGEGLNCPSHSTLSGLVSGTSQRGEQFVASVQENFYSTPKAPLSLYHCLEPLRCPGGAPGRCAGGLLGTACTDCPAGQSYDRTECRECSGWQQFLWILAVVIIFVGLIVAYYLLTSQSTAKASVLFTTTCAFGMTLSSLQAVGIIGMMTVDFPADLKGIFDFLQIFVLDLDSFAFSCVAGAHAPIRYIASVIFFPAAVLWLIGWRHISRLFPAGYQWEDAKTKSTIGALLQAAFSTMSTTAMQPMMCFTHPNGVHSLLKYPGVTCGTEEHTLMLVFGTALLLFGVLGFLAVCVYAVLVVPRWSSSGQHAKVKAFRFLLFRFRLDIWWFGVLLLARGPLMSLPIALATDYPPVQVMCVILVFLVFFGIEANAWPWKVPLLNVLDCFIGFCITMLVASNALHVGVIEGSMKTFAEAFTSVIMGMVCFAMASLTIMTMSALIFRAALGGQKELLMFNLCKLPSPALVASTLMSTANQLKVMGADDLAHSIGALAVYDVKLLVAGLSVVSTEILKAGELETRLKSRISSGSFAAVAPKPKPKPTPPADIEESNKELQHAHEPDSSKKAEGEANSFIVEPAMHAYI